MALGFWAYRENYTTQDAMGEVSELQNEIANLRESLKVQRAEWAYLNRPERLRDLSTVNFDRLGLLPMEPGQFGSSAMIAFPLPKIEIPMNLSGTQSVSGVLNADPEEASTP